MCLHWEVDKLWYVCTMEYCSAKKRKKTTDTDSMDESQMHYAKRKKSDSKAHILQVHLYDILGKAKLESSLSN